MQHIAQYLIHALRQELESVEIVILLGLVSLLEELDIELAFFTFQEGKVVLIQMLNLPQDDPQLVVRSDLYPLL